VCGFEPAHVFGDIVVLDSLATNRTRSAFRALRWICRICSRIEFANPSRQQDLFRFLGAPRGAGRYAVSGVVRNSTA
jgi:hypothetical protein